MEKKIIRKKQKNYVHDIFVIDNSGSMGNYYVDTLNNTLKRREEVLMNNYISVIISNSSSNTILIEEKRLSELSYQISIIENNSGTDFSSGVELAERIIFSESNYIGNNCRLFLLTDGELSENDLKRTNKLLSRI